MSIFTRVFKFISNASQTYAYTLPVLNKTLHYSTNQEIGLIKTIINSNDLLLHNLRIASSPKNVLELVSIHHKIMNNKHLMQALRSLFSLQKSGNSDLSTNEIMTHPHFNTLCSSLKSQIRSIELNETIEALKVVSYIGIASNSTIMQVLLQLIRHNINLLSLHQIIFLDFLLKQFQSTPLSDALLIALPIVFELNLQMKIDKENISHLSDLLQFVSKKNVSDSTIDFVVETILLHRHLHTKEATSIVWSLCDLKHQESFDPLLRKALKVIVQNGQDIKISDLETTLSKLTYRFSANQLSYYDEEFSNLVADSIIDKDLGFQQALWILQKFSKVGHSHNDLLDYLAEKCIQDQNLITKANHMNLFILVTGFASTEYKCQHWDNIREIILQYENYHNIKREFNWMKFASMLAILDIFIPSVLEQAFNKENINKILHNGIFESYKHFLTLYQTISTLQPNYSKLLPSADFINQMIDRFRLNRVQEYPLQSALERGFGGKQYILSNVTTKLNHEIHHVVVMRKGGYPVAFNNLNSNNPVILENLQVPIDSQIIVILGLNVSYYKLNGHELQGIYSLMIKTLEASGHSVVIIPIQIWKEIPDYEKIPYLMRSIRDKNEEFEKLTVEL